MLYSIGCLRFPTLFLASREVLASSSNDSCRLVHHPEAVATKILYASRNNLYYFQFGNRRRDPRRQKYNMALWLHRELGLLPVRRSSNNRKWYETEIISEKKRQVGVIELFQLLAQIVESDLQRPIALAIEDVPNGAQVVVSGWGRVLYPSNSLPTALQKLNLTVVNITVCQNYWSSTIIYSSYLCGLRETGKGVCNVSCICFFLNRWWEKFRDAKSNFPRGGILTSRFLASESLSWTFTANCNRYAWNFNCRVTAEVLWSITTKSLALFPGEIRAPMVSPTFIPGSIPTYPGLVRSFTIQKLLLKIFRSMLTSRQTLSTGWFNRLANIRL